MAAADLTDPSHFVQRPCDTNLDSLAMATPY
jgi:hypothetical protein